MHYTVVTEIKKHTLKINPYNYLRATYFLNMPITEIVIHLDSYATRKEKWSWKNQIFLNTIFYKKMLKCEEKAWFEHRIR